MMLQATFIGRGAVQSSTPLTSIQAAGTKCPCIWTNIFLAISVAPPPSNLHDLEIAHKDLWVDDEPPTTHFSMNSKPSPTCLTIQAFRLSTIDVAWRNVTCLTLRRIPPHECIEAIKLAPLLESCTLSELDLSADGDSTAFHSQQVFKHMDLRKLFLRGTEVESLIIFNKGMEFSSLEELTYEAEGDFAVHSLISLFNRSGNRLKGLTLVMDDDSEEIAQGLIELLLAMPSFQNLKCEFPDRLFVHAWNNFLQQLSSLPPVLPGGIPGFLPILQSLTLCFEYSKRYSWGYIPRIFSGSHIKVEVQKIAMHGDDRDKISQFIREGFNILILERGQDYFQSLQRFK